MKDGLARSGGTRSWFSSCAASWYVFGRGCISSVVSRPRGHVSPQMTLPGPLLPLMAQPLDLSQHHLRLHLFSLGVALLLAVARV